MARGPPPPSPPPARARKPVLQQDLQRHPSALRGSTDALRASAAPRAAWRGGRVLRPAGPSPCGLRHGTGGRRGQAEDRRGQRQERTRGGRFDPGAARTAGCPRLARPPHVGSHPESAGRGQSVPLSAKCGRSTHERSGRPRLSQAAPSFSRHLGRPAVASGLRGRCISSNCRARRGPFPPWRSVRFRGLRKTTHHEPLREQGRGVGPVCRVLEPSMAAPDSQNPGPSSSETCPSSGHPLHRHWFPGGSGRKS